MRAEQLPLIASVSASAEHALIIVWREGRSAELTLADVVGVENVGVRNAAEARVEPWGHNIVWPDGLEIGADSLWLASLSAWGEEDARAFLEWRLRHALSASGAAEALGLRRAEVVAYSTGRRPVPRAITLACRGWEALRAAA